MNFEKKFSQLLSSSHFIIYILTDEEERLEYSLNNISRKVFHKNILTWDFIDGYTKNPNYDNKAKKNPLEALQTIEMLTNANNSIFLLKDFSDFINDLSIIRKIKNLSKWLNKHNQYIVISSSTLHIPTTLEEYIILIKFPPPNQKEIKMELERLFSVLTINTPSLIEQLSIAYKGFSINKIRKSISTIELNKISSNEITSKILREKQQIIQKTQILQFYNVIHDINRDIAGLTNLKKWLKIRKNAFSVKAYNYGVNIPKGILLVGIQGTGKSLSAKAISSEWKIPLLKLNINNIFTGLLGESENKLKQMIDICEKISPCVLWIDEIDKIFTNHSSSNDSGTTNRINNIFLTWLAERNSPVFIVATANNFNILPIELLRKGRFDEIFFVNLPNFYDRIHIFKIHLKKIRPMTWQKYNLYYLSYLSKKFSGSEIEQSIIEAMYNAFSDNREFSTWDIAKSIQSMIPLAFTHESYILKLQEWVISGKIKIA